MIPVLSRPLVKTRFLLAVLGGPLLAVAVERIPTIPVRARAVGAPGPLVAVASALSTRALQESAIPVRPGQPGGQPFWNGEAVQFLYAPAFDFAPAAGAQSYRFTIRPETGAELAFTAAQPWTPLSSVWTQLPVGPASLTLQAFDAKGAPLGLPQRRSFHRAAPFGGSYAAPALPWRESARTALDALVHSPDLRCWFSTGMPDAQFHLYRYPYKIVGAAAAALAIYATQTPAPDDAAAVLQAARRAADYLLSLSLPADAAWAFHPPTYHPTLFGDRLRGHMVPENYMTTSGAESGLYYLEIYSATRDTKYLAAAIRIAETYARHQQPGGSWPLFVHGRDGSLVAENTMIPTLVVEFLDRLGEATGSDRFAAMRDRAVAWVEANPVRTWNWQGQFEDVKPQPPYQNLTKHDACDFAIHLLRVKSLSQTQRALALDLVRFAEDQFVMWAQPPTATPGKQSADGVAAAKSTRWMLPCVLEQYRCYAPVCASSAKLIRTYLAAYRATQDELFLVKARALAATLTRTQANTKAPGRYLTWVMQPTGFMWFNCELMAVQAMQELAAINAPADLEK